MAVTSGSAEASLLLARVKRGFGFRRRVDGRRVAVCIATGATGRLSLILCIPSFIFRSVSIAKTAVVTGTAACGLSLRKSLAIKPYDLFLRIACLADAVPPQTVYRP